MLKALAFMLPSPDSPDYEARLNEVYDRLGRPKTPVGQDGYKLPFPVDEDWRSYAPPQQVPLIDSLVERFSHDAHKAGLSQRQYEALMQGQVEFAQQAAQQQAQRVEEIKSEALGAMKSTYGEHFGNIMAQNRSVV